MSAFVSSPPDSLEPAYQRLVGTLWSEGKPTDAALDAVPLLITALGEVGADRQGYLAVLLGLLPEAEYPRLDGDVATAVRAGLDRYLELLRGSAGGLDPLTLALLYLVGHFPGDRDRILAVTDELDLEVEERSRLQRALSELDPAHPDLGRAWPAPSVWQLDEEDAAHAEAAIRGLTPEQTRLNWENDTRTGWAYSGAIAYWAVRNGPPAPITVREVPQWQPSQRTPTPSPDATFGEYGDALRCPTCHGPVTMGTDGAYCDQCAVTYLSVNGILDLSAGVRDGQPAHEATADLLQKLSEMPKMGLAYENLLRPAYLRMAGNNFGNVVTKAVEDAYVTEQLGRTEGLVVDLAAGAGTWTAVVADAVGADRLIAVDMLLPMLNVLRDRLPDVTTVRASALNLPFVDGTVGAINLWNALQAFPDDAAQAIAEIGRCLRPGGILTMMTYRWSDDPIARHFQAAHYFPSRPEGHLLFDLEQLHQWLADAGLAVRDEITDKGTFVFVTAERVGRDTHDSLEEQERSMENRCPVLDPNGRDLHGQADALRAQASAVQVELPGGVVVWSVNSHDVIKRLLTDPNVTKSARNHWPAFTNGEIRPDWELISWVAMDNVSTVYGADHHRLRRLIGKAFTPRRAEEIRPRVVEITTMLLDALAATPPGEVVDLKAAFAYPLPGMLVADLIGMSEEARVAAAKVLDVMLDTTITPEQAQGVLVGWRSAVADLVAIKRARPGADITSDLIQARDDDGSALSEQELSDTIFAILGAGSETTINFMDKAIALLLSHPEQLERVKSGEAGWGDVIDEVLRLESPIANLPLRYAVEDIDLGDVVIPKGDPILVNYAAIGRDPALHGETRCDFDIERKDKTHLSFGYGPHFCLGAGIATMLATIGLSTLFDRFPGLSLAVPAEELQPLPTFIMNGHRSLPVLLAPVPNPAVTAG